MQNYVPLPMDLFGVVVARYPRLDEPDPRAYYEGNKYKTEIVTSLEKTKEMKKWLEEQAAIIAAGVRSPRLPMRKGMKDGVVSFVLKSKDRPKLWDAKGNRIPDGAVKIGEGSKIRVGGALLSYDSGVHFDLSDVQLVELIGGNVTVNAVEGEGYVYDAAG
jgi:hypothetical protein